MYKTEHAFSYVIYFEDIDQLCERLISVWCELDQSVVNHATDECMEALSVGLSRR